MLLRTAKSECRAELSHEHNDTDTPVCEQKFMKWDLISPAQACAKTLGGGSPVHFASCSIKKSCTPYEVLYMIIFSPTWHLRGSEPVDL